MAEESLFEGTSENKPNKKAVPLMIIFASVLCVILASVVHDRIVSGNGGGQQPMTGAVSSESDTNKDAAGAIVEGEAAETMRQADVDSLEQEAVAEISEQKDAGTTIAYAEKSDEAEGEQRSDGVGDVETKAEEQITATKAVPQEIDSVDAESDDSIEIINGIRAPKADFLFPESSSRLLTEEEFAFFEGTSKDEMHFRSQIAINEIFVRYGYVFTGVSETAAAARNLFKDKDWYKQAQQYCPSQDSNVLLHLYMNTIEHQNIDNICQWQKEHDVYY